MEILWDDRSGDALSQDIYPLLTEVMRLGLAYANAPKHCEISVSFVSPDEIKQLNRDYRQLDRETDVLSFPFYDMPLPEATADMPLALGDIVVCTQVAAAQAELYGHSRERELAFLTVHGLLHLLGYDHEAPEEEQEMLDAQQEILRKAQVER